MLSGVNKYWERQLPSALRDIDPELAHRLPDDAILAVFDAARECDVKAISVTEEVDFGKRMPDGVMGLITPDERWHINVTSLGKDVAWQLIANLVYVITMQSPPSPAALIPLIRSLATVVRKLTVDEGDVAATLTRMMRETVQRSVPRTQLETAYVYDPTRDGAMPAGTKPIDAPTVIDALIDKEVIEVRADGRLTVPF